MANKILVVDTSVFIEYLRAQDKKKSTLYKIEAKTQLLISSVTLYELLMGAKNHEKEKDIDLLTSDLGVLSFDAAVSKKAASIYHQLKEKNKIIEFRDIFIGATCLVYNYPLLTLNKKHFDRIPGLKLA